MNYFENRKWIILILILTIVLLFAIVGLLRANDDDVEKTVSPISNQEPTKPLPEVKTYMEIDYPTPNYDRERRNDVQGVILHHTAEPTVEKSLSILTSRAKKVGTHVVIDTDGTRYIMAKPTVATYHAGLSILNNREGCNYFTIGIEFQGNTLEAPLTEDQIASGIDYLKPIISLYKIPIENIVTHEMVRAAYMLKYPNRRCSSKVDITPEEYNRFMKALRTALTKEKDNQ